MKQEKDETRRKADQDGASEHFIMAQIGHKNVMVACRYIRGGSVFRKNAAEQVGL